MMLKIFFILALISSTSAREIGKVKYVRGKVLVTLNKKSSSVKKGQVIIDKSLFETMGKSLVVISLIDGSKIKLNELSKLSVSVPKNKKSPTKTGLYKGSSFFKVLKSKIIKKQKFIVKTRTASLGVRGTEFYVSYGKEKKVNDAWMCVNKGLVAVRPRKSKAEVLVKSGEGVHISTAKKVSAPKPLPWTKKLNWKFNKQDGDLENKVNIEDAYSDVLGHDYD